MDLNDPNSRHDPRIGERQVRRLKSQLNTPLFSRSYRFRSRDSKNMSLASSPLKKETSREPSVGGESDEPTEKVFDDRRADLARANGRWIGRRQMFKTVATLTCLGYVCGFFTGSLTTAIITTGVILTAAAAAFSLGYTKGIYEVYNNS